MAILPLLVHKDWKVLLQVVRLWSVVLSSNLVGTFLFAFCIGRVALFNPQVHQALGDIGAAYIGARFGIVFMRAIFAGWLIALIVWLLSGAESARVSIIIITYFVGLGGFNHIVAGSTTMFFPIVTKSITWGSYFVDFFVPTLLENIVGGVSLVAAQGHARVVGGET
jgi:formate/nitrite transporter FocA (FNT family)